MPDKPAKKPADESRRTNVLLESVRKDFDFIAESLSGLTDSVGALSKRLEAVEGKLDVVEPIVRSLAPTRDELKSMSDVLRGLAKDVDLLKYSTVRNTQEVDAVKTELRLVRSDLKSFDDRLIAVEAKAGS